ncbi:MAG: hypothetical protein JNM17_35980 [Archangium sp.]|nr:hypothetical protein [Archangium sp.]
MFAILAIVLAQSTVECDSPDACLEAARTETNAERAKEFRQRAVALSALRDAKRRANAVKLAPSSPPLVEAVGEEVLPHPDPLPEGEGNSSSSSSLELPAPAPTDPEPAVSVVETSERAPPTRVGLAVTGGIETGPQLVTNEWQARGRAGIGARIALTERNPPGEELEAVPAATFLAGYAGRIADPTDHRVFGEARIELLAARPHGMLAPAFTAYLLSGVDLLVGDPGFGAQPYFGAGVGWDVNPFAGAKGEKGGKTVTPGNVAGGIGGGILKGLGSAGGGGAGAAAAVVLIPIAIVAVAVVTLAVIAYVCVGRFEVRYHPWTARGSQPTLSMLFGYGF